MLPPPVAPEPVLRLAANDGFVGCGTQASVMAKRGSVAGCSDISLYSSRYLSAPGLGDHAVKNREIILHRISVFRAQENTGVLVEEAGPVALGWFGWALVVDEAIGTAVGLMSFEEFRRLPRVDINFKPNLARVRRRRKSK